jgi:hypothetical protein
VGDPSVSIAEGWLPASVNDAMRAQLADVAKLLLDQGGEIVTTGSAGAYAVALSTAPSSYANNLLFVCKLNHDAPGPSTMNINGLGAKDFKQLVEGVASPLTVGDGPAGHRAMCVYSTADNAVLMLNPAGVGVLYEENGEDLSANVYNASIMYPAPPGTYEWYQNENFGIVRGSFAVLDEATGSAPPYKGDYGGWMPLFFARNYGTTSAPSGSAYQHPQESEGTPKVYLRGGLVMREEDDAIDLVGDRLNFDGSGQITSPPNPTDAAPVIRMYSRIAGVDHFNVNAGGGSPKAIAAINIATSTITTSTLHGLAVNDRVVIAGVGGTTQLNTSGQGYSNNGYVVRTVPSTSTLTLQNLASAAISFSGWGAWTSGGTVTKAAAHYGISHPGTGTTGRFALYQQRYIPAADYSTTGRYSGYHEFQATRPASLTPSALETAARIYAPTLASGSTGLRLFVYDGSSTVEREVKTKALGDLDPSDRVLYVDQAEAGVGRILPYNQQLSSNGGVTLTVEQNGYTIYSGSPPSRAVFTGPAVFPAGLRYRFVSGGVNGQRFVVGAGTIRGRPLTGPIIGTSIQNDTPQDGDAIVVETVSELVTYVVSMVGDWRIS